MKILFFLGHSNPFPGAAWRRIGFFAEDWSKKGHSIEILGAVGYKSFTRSGFRKLGELKIFNLILNIGSIKPIVFILNSLISFATSIIFLIARKPKIAIVSVPLGDFGLGALIACKLARVTCIVDYRDEWEDYAISQVNSRFAEYFHSITKKFISCLYADCSLVACVTPNLVKSLKCRGVDNVRLITNGADTEIFKPLINEGSNEDFEIFYSGMVGGYYRMDVMVKALKKLIDRGLKNVKLVIAGKGKVQNVLNLALELGISGHVTYNGSIDDKVKLAELIAEADVGLIPYDDNPLWKNALPAKFFEYCSCGVPVVATIYEDSILAQLINKHGLGLVSPPMDEEKLAESIYRIYENKSFREAAGRRGRVFIEEKFDRNHISDIFLSLVEQVAHNQSLN